MVELQSLGLIDGNAAFFAFVETPESFTQVFMHHRGVLEVHANVVFEANTAGIYGGAVCLPFDTVAFLPVCCFVAGFAMVSLIR